MERVELIKKVFATLERVGIKYCVLRNYDFLLEGRNEVAGSERSVDLVVAGSDFKQFLVVMQELGFSLREDSFSLKHKAFFKIEDLIPVSFDVQVGGVYWNDGCYLGERFVLGNKVRKGWFFVPCENDTFVMLLLHSILGKRYFKQEYKKILIFLRNQVDRSYVLLRLQAIFSKSLAQQLCDLAFESDFEKIIAVKYRYIRAFVLRSPFSFGLLSLRWLWWKRLKLYPLISVIGPDGAGKSTMTEALKKYLELQGKKVAVVYTGRGRNQLLPFGTIGRKYKSREKQQDKVRKCSLWKRKMLYTCAAPVFALDLWMRYWFQVFPARVKGKIVITDRYCTDLMLMQYVPVWFKKIMIFFFPRPTLTFYLYNTPEVLYARREEESVEELERQLGLFLVLEHMIKPIKIKTTDQKKNQEEVFALVMSFIYKEWY